MFFLHFEMIVVKKTNLETILPIRHQVLRKGKPIESCFFDADIQKDTIHFGVFKKEKIVGCVTVFKNINCNFEAQNQFQIRGMAILESFQNKGIGKQILQACENNIPENNVLVWLHARKNALPFYQKMGYTIVGIPFEIENIGIHYLMVKKI